MKLNNIKFYDIDKSPFEKYLLDSDGYIKRSIIEKHETSYVINSLDDEEHTFEHKGLEVSFKRDKSILIKGKGWRSYYKLTDLHIYDICVVEKHFNLDFKEIDKPSYITMKLDDKASSNDWIMYNISSNRSVKYSRIDVDKVFCFASWSLDDPVNISYYLFNKTIVREIEDGYITNLTK